jgi:hypothetical protein
MEECLAIKPDLIFLWDRGLVRLRAVQSVFAPRTAMGAAARPCASSFADAAYRERYRKFKASAGELNPKEHEAA